jgi:hypothetical protein
MALVVSAGGIQGAAHPEDPEDILIFLGGLTTSPIPLTLTIPRDVYLGSDVLMNYWPFAFVFQACTSGCRSATLGRSAVSTITFTRRHA